MKSERIRPYISANVSSHVLLQHLSASHLTIFQSHEDDGTSSSIITFPEYSDLFCALIGVGDHLLVMSCLVLLLGFVGYISTMEKRGSIIACIITSYCLSSIVGGYRSVRLYRQMTFGKHEKTTTNGLTAGMNGCLVCTVTIVPIPAAGVFIGVNLVGIAYGSTIAVPITVIFILLVLYLLVAVPLTLIGGTLAKTYACADFGIPTACASPSNLDDGTAGTLPDNSRRNGDDQIVKWLQFKPTQLLIAGIIPFSTIWIELEFILKATWGYQTYTFWGLLAIQFILVLAVSCSITVLLLVCEIAKNGIADGSWWWSTYLNGCMTGVVVYVYSFYYYFHRSGMNGVLQTSFYFGYMAIISFAFFLMLGSAGFQFSLQFVKYIYSRVKCD